MVLLIPLESYSQTLSIGFGPNYTLTTQRVRMVNSKNYFDNTDGSFKFAYYHDILKDKFSISIAYTKFEGITFIAFEEGSVIQPDGAIILAIGFYGVDVNRFDIGINYKLISRGKFYLEPSITLGLQQSIPIGIDFYDRFVPNGPDYVQTGPINTETFNTTQIVPSFGFKTGFVFWNRLDLGLDFRWIFGFKSFQDMYFEYSYKGVPQKTAVFEATGTGLFTALSLGYRFKKWKDEKQSK